MRRDEIAAVEGWAIKALWTAWWNSRLWLKGKDISDIEWFPSSRRGQA